MDVEKTPRTSGSTLPVPSASPKPAQAKNETDVEAGTQLERGLRSRHLQFIAVGGTIGTGLFLGTGGALANAGPVSLLIAFIFIGSVVYSVMTALGEMAAYIPVPGAFTAYASRFVDPTLGFAMGWIYWLSWSLTFALELTAAGLIIQYWDKSISVGVWIAVFWVLFTAINYLPVRWFGEFEMWFSSIKVVTIIGFIIFSIVVNAGGVGDQGYTGFEYWSDPGAFNAYIKDGSLGKFIGFWSVLVTAGFSYQGVELVAIGAGEAADPRRTIPSAIRWTFAGIFTLFVSTVFFLGLNIPYDNPDLLSESKDANASPLVIVAKLAGVNALPDIINAVLLSAVLTAANSNVYSSSRILVALADSGHAPAIFKKTNRIGTPYISVAVCSAVGFLAFLNLFQGGTVVFDWLLNIVAIGGFICWALINVCHLRFMRALAHRGISRSSLPFAAPLQPYLSWFGLFFTVLIVLTSGFEVFIQWNTSTFFANYVSLILFVVLYAVHKVFMRTRIVPLDKVDLVTNCVDS